MNKSLCFLWNHVKSPQRFRIFPSNATWMFGAFWPRFGMPNLPHLWLLRDTLGAWRGTWEDASRGGFTYEDSSLWISNHMDIMRIYSYKLLKSYVNGYIYTINTHCLWIITYNEDISNWIQRIFLGIIVCPFESQMPPPWRSWHHFLRLMKKSTEKKKQQKQTPNVTLPSQIIRVGLKIGCPSESCLFEVSPHLLNKTYFDLIINLLHCI